MTRRAAVPVQAMQDELREAVLVAERALLHALGFDLTRGGACSGDAGRAARGGAGGGARAAVRAGLWPDAAMPVQAMQDELREAVLVAERALLCALGFGLTRRCLFRRCRTSCARRCWWRSARCCARWALA